MKCPDFSDILDFIDSKMESGAKKKLEQHLKSGCDHCQESIHRASRLIGLMQSNQIVEAPDYVVNRAVSLFKDRKKGLLDWVRGKLDFDSWTVPAVAGLRSMDRGPRQLTYSTENYEVVLMLQADKKGATLTGQLLAKNPDTLADGCLVQVASKNKILESRLTNGEGEFVVPSVPSKEFDLLIHGDLESIRISL